MADAHTLLDDDARCPCLSGESYGACCGRLHRGAADAATAEALMRSRFSAFAVGDAAYLLRSWHSSTRPAELELDAELRWYRLDIDGTSRGGLLDAEGTVEFTAFYRDADGRGSQHENSRFVREAGRWVYLD
ncbi:YchJ family protein [Microterricola viridarii]|uniref:Zinc-binding protein n=1 Tax=Microterricola viridarii TaxID=412690 RepID=A0A0X8E469_9MICO|nr:YchJ family metal-binding protein [Microterricola viridarii]AMB59232.1 zinc-binding protein [Microterricola viridarii]